jgi:hypothetical protein
MQQPLAGFQVHAKQAVPGASAGAVAYENEFCLLLLLQVLLPLLPGVSLEGTQAGLQRTGSTAATGAGTAAAAALSSQYMSVV